MSKGPEAVLAEVYTAASRAFVAQGICSLEPSAGQTVTLLYATALALGRIAPSDPQLKLRWETTQDLALERLRARRGG